MVYIDNSETQREMNDAIRGNSVTNVAPVKVNDFIQPVININPKDYRRNFIKTLTKGTSGSNDILAANPNKDVYVTSCWISCTKNAASDATAAWISLTNDGDSASTQICRINFQTLTALSNECLFVNFVNPVKIKRNTAIELGTSFTVGAQNLTASFSGYYVEN